MTSIVRFQNKERAYREWRDTHVDGYVFNHFEGVNPRMNVIHRANCGSLSTAKDEGARTVIEKICSIDRAELEEVVSMLRGGPSGWTCCRSCMMSTK